MIPALNGVAKSPGVSGHEKGLRLWNKYVYAIHQVSHRRPWLYIAKTAELRLRGYGTRGCPDDEPI